MKQTLQRMIRDPMCSRNDRAYHCVYEAFERNDFADKESYNRGDHGRYQEWPKKSIWNRLDFPLVLPQTLAVGFEHE
jgi:hypothetical protein